MLWEVEISPLGDDREGERVLHHCREFGAESITSVRTARGFLLQGDLDLTRVQTLSQDLLVDGIVESSRIAAVTASPAIQTPGSKLLNVLCKAGVTDTVADTVKQALTERGYAIDAVRTTHKFWFNADARAADLERVASRVLSNDAIQQTVWGPLHLETLSVGSDYRFEKVTVPLLQLDDAALMQVSRQGQLSLTLPEMQTIQQHFLEQGRDPTDAELETIAQTWSEHCSHKTLRGRVRYREGQAESTFNNLLKETIFAATAKIREKLGADDWCVSVFQDNAGVVKFDDQQHVCFKVETHNHPSAIEPYGGANTGLGGVIRDPLGTGLGAKPVCNTDVFCFAPPDTPAETLPKGVLHPRVVMQGVVAGVRDYGNRMGIPTVNGAILFDERYLGNPLVFCGNVAMIPVDKVEKGAQPGDLIVALGGRTGRDGIHGATFSSVELTHESETLSGGAVQIGNAITEKMVMDVLLQARDLNLYSGVTDCGAGGFSSAVGEMGAETGALVKLEQAPLKYAGLSYTEIWISEAQERMVLSVPPAKWEQFRSLCAAEGVEATVLGEFTNTGRLVLTYKGTEVGNISMHFLHEGRPPVVRDAVYDPRPAAPLVVSRSASSQFDDDLQQILGSLNVCSKEWVIRQYDHEVQAGSVVKPLVGVCSDGPSDAAVVRPDLNSHRGLVIACGMNPRFGDLDPYWMAASAIDEAVRNCVAVGADPDRIAILDNFCWGFTDRPETLGTLVRASLGCHDTAVAFGTPFISGKDSLNNEFSYVADDGTKRTVAIPASLLISALGQMPDLRHAVTMDMKAEGNRLFLVGQTFNELGGSHFAHVRGLTGGEVPHVDLDRAPQIFRAMYSANCNELLRSVHDLSEGGLAVALAEMCFAGGLGAEVSLQPMAAAAHLQDDVALLFSESNTRFLLEVEPAAVERLLEVFHGLPLVELGATTSSSRLQITGVNRQKVIDSDWNELKACWQKPLAWE